MDPVSLKVTKFSKKSSRDFQKLPSASVRILCDYHCKVPLDLNDIPVCFAWCWMY